MLGRTATELKSAVRMGFPRRQEPTARPRLSHTGWRGTAPIAVSTCQCPAITSGAVREGNIRAHRIRE